MIATLREGTEHSSVSLAALEAEIRMGQVDPDTELCFPPWTGPRFCPLRHVPQLAEAWDAPDARFHLWMKTRRPPVLALGVAGLITLAAAAQTLLVRQAAAGDSVAARGAAAVVRWGAVGFDPTLLSGHWWSPLVSQLVHAPHAPLMHLAANLPVLAYCGIRVQRALGAGGYAVVAALSVLCGAALIIAGSNLPVVGSSLLAYGLWAAQIAIGFRMARSMPPALRGFYGWGTWVIFAPLTVLNAGAGELSQLGHLGAVAGGLLAVAVLEPESAVPRDRERAQRLRNLVFAALLLGLSALAALVLPWAPRLLVAPGVDTPVAAAGVSLALPTRMAPFSTQRWGMDVFRPSPDTDEVLFVSLSEEPVAVDEPAFWSARLGAAVVAESPAVREGDGLEQMLQVVNSKNTVQHIDVRTLRRGRWALRTGAALADPEGPRARFYDQVLDSLVVSDPPELAGARRALALSPDSPRRVMALVDALVRADGWEEADTLLARLAQREDGWGARARAWRRVLPRR